MKSGFQRREAAGRRVPNELLGLDLGASGVKAVRLRRGKDAVALVGAELLPPLDPAAPKVVLPPQMLTNYAAVAFAGPQHVVRLVTVPGAGEAAGGLAARLQEAVKVEPNQRLAFRGLRTLPGKRETQVLTVAAPEAEVRGALGLFAHGAPAALALEEAGLAALAAFYRGPGRDLGDEAVCFIDSGARATFVAFLSKGVPVLIRTLELGGEHVVASLQKQWGFDRETALGMLGEGATVDITQPLHELAAPSLRQLSISRDFVERQEACRMTRVFLSGGLGQVKQWGQEIQEVLRVPTGVWDPFAALAAPALPAALHGHQARFAAAVGVALAAFEES